MYKGLGGGRGEGEEGRRKKGRNNECIFSR
jgi:hypothetical protein